MKNKTFQQLTRAACGLALSASSLFASHAIAGDVVMWGHTPDRNMISTDKGIPTEWDVEKGTNIKWVAQLGSKSYGNPIIANGMVFVGTNNEAHKDPANEKDAGNLMAFAEQDGKFLWQRISAKLPTGRVNDWPGEGLCSTVLMDGGRLYYCTNRCEVVCLDVTPGGDGKFKELWTVDMMKQFGVFPHNMTSCAILPYEDMLYVITGNGVDDTHKHVVSPNAPAIVALKKADGKKVWDDNSPLDHVLHGQWASPALAVVNGKAQVIAPEGDGWIRSYDAKTGKIIWQFDSNPKDSVYPQTRNEIIATPVIYKNRCYIANGQDPEHGEGPGQFWCIDITKEGDISFELNANPNAPKPKVGEELVQPAANAKPKAVPNPNSGVVWHFSALNQDKKVLNNWKLPADQRMNRTIATCAIDPATGLLFVPDFSGFLHCLDAETGEHVWTEDLASPVWGSPLICDGKVYQGSEDGFVRIYDVAKKVNKVAEHDMGSPVYSTPVYANGTLYIMSRDKLFAISDKK